MDDRNISTECLFHYTNSIDTIISILTNNFYPQYCIEDNISALHETQGWEMAIPMVCFCDIPIFQIKKHRKYYGNYAIGLKKEWGIKSKINPVLYTYPNSLFTDNYTNGLLKLYEGGDNIELIFDDFKRASRFMKIYRGTLWRKGVPEFKNVHFYDEREWRYIPQDVDVKNIPYVDGKADNFPNTDLKPRSCATLNSYNEEIIFDDKNRLFFEPNDIMFIIVEKEDEVYHMSKMIVETKSKFSYKDIEILKTRIISMETIDKNF